MFDLYCMYICQWVNINYSGLCDFFHPVMWSHLDQMLQQQICPLLFIGFAEEEGIGKRGSERAEYRERIAG